MKRAPHHALLVIAAVSLSLLTYQVLLTRVTALRMFFHFSYLVISHGMLGLGAAASLVTVFQARLLREPRTWLFRLCGLYFVSLAAGGVYALAFACLPATRIAAPRAAMLRGAAAPG